MNAARPIPPAVADLYRSAAVGDPQAQARIADVIKKARAGEPGAVAVKKHLDGIAAVEAAVSQAPADARALAQAANRPTLGKPVAVRVLNHRPGGDPFDRSFYDGVVPNDKLSRLYDGGQGIGLVRQATENAPSVPDKRPLAGAQQNNRGHAVILSPGTFVAKGGLSQYNPSIVNSIVETSKQNGEDAENIYVTLGLDFKDTEPGAWPPSNFLLINAVLTWGIGGCSYSAVIDWQAGLAFSLCASFLRIGAIYVSDSPTTTPDAILSASLGYGYQSQTTSSTRLTSLIPRLDADGDSAEIQVPRFATSFGVNIISNVWGGSTLAQIDLLPYAGAIPVIASYVYGSPTNAGGQSENTFPVLAGTQYVRVTNRTGGNIGNMGRGVDESAGTVVFNLSL